MALFGAAYAIPPLRRETQAKFTDLLFVWAVIVVGSVISNVADSSHGDARTRGAGATPAARVLAAVPVALLGGALYWLSGLPGAEDAEVFLRVLAALMWLICFLEISAAVVSFFRNR